MSEIPLIHWLASYPKSGNTWIRTLLYAYDFDNINIDQMKGHVLGDLTPGPWFAASPVPWGWLNDNQRMLLRYGALMALAMTSIRETVIVKTHSANIRVNSVEMIPDELTGDSVYIVRDPRDVAISYANHMGVAIDDAIDKMSNIGLVLHQEDTGLAQTAGSWSANVKSWYEDGTFNRTIVRYEDLLENPEEELTEILKRFYGEEPNQKRVKKAVKLCRFEKLKKQEKEKGFKEASKHGKFFRKGRSTWQEVLTPEQIYKIEQDHGEWMIKLGYELAAEFKLE